MLENIRSAIGTRPNLKRTLSGFSYFFSEKITRVLLGFFLQTWLARHLGPEGMGDYSYVADFVAIFIPIVLFGFDDILVHELVKTKTPGRVLGTILHFRLRLGVLVWFVLCLGIWLFRREAMPIVLATVIYGTLIIVRSFDTFTSYFHAHFLAKQLVASRQLSYGIGSALRALGLWLGFGINYFLVNNYFQSFLEKFIVFLQARRHLPERLVYDKQYLKDVLPLAFPIALTTFFSYAETRMGTFFLHRFNSLESVGEFGVGRGLLDIWDFLPATLCLTVFPVIIKFHAEDDEIYRNKLHKIYAGLFYLALGFAIAIFLAAPYVVDVLYGPAFNDTATVLRYGSFLAIITYLNMARVKWYILEGVTYKWLYICASTFLLNFIFQFYFTRKFGVTGPYMAAAAAHLITNVLFFIFDAKVRIDLLHIAHGIFLPIKAVYKRL